MCKYIINYRCNIQTEHARKLITPHFLRPINNRPWAQFKSNVQAAQTTEWMGKAFLHLKFSIQFLENYHSRLNKKKKRTNLNSIAFNCLKEFRETKGIIEYSSSKYLPHWYGFLYHLIKHVST